MCEYKSAVKAVLGGDAPTLMKVSGAVSAVARQKGDTVPEIVPVFNGYAVRFKTGMMTIPQLPMS